MAILLNLSFIMCQLAVDLSNVLGVGLRNMFGSIGNALGANTVSGNFIGDMIAGIFTGGAVVGAAAGTITAAMIVRGPMAVIMVILALVAVLVAVLLFFIMLGARKVIVMVCIVLAPIAFVMYILPNTQGIFKKWWNLFKAALIVFPICGALGGISNMVRGLVGSGGEVWEYVVALLLPYLPFFLLPSLLKGAIAGLGVIGGAITAGLTALRTGANRAIDTGRSALQGSEAYKNAQGERARRMQERNAQRTINRLNARRRATGGLSEADTRRLARAQEAQRRLAGEDTAARTVLAQSDYANKSEADLQRDWDEAFDSGDTERMDALTNVMVSRYGASAAKFIAGRLDKKQIFNADGSDFSTGNYEKSFNALRMNMESNSALAGNMKNKASDAYQMLTSGGYIERIDENGNKRQVRGNLAEHSAKNNVATKLSDWATQSGSTLKRAAIGGALSAETAQQLLDSDDPAIKSGIASDADSRKILQAIAAGYRGENGGWNPEHANDAINRGEMDRLHAQALAENAEFDVRRAQEIERAHGDDLEENKQREAQERRDRTQESIAQSLRQMNVGGGFGGNGGQNAGGGPGGGNS